MFILYILQNKNKQLQMIKNYVLFAVVASTFLASIGKAFDAKASRVGVLSTTTVSLLALMISTSLAFVAMMVLNRKQLLSELKAAPRSREFKYLLLSSTLFLTSVFTLYWLYRTEKFYFVSVLSTALLFLFTMFVGSVVLKESVSWQSWVGVALIVVGLVLIAKNKHVEKN
jgi:drug/metabolite transporter (DMT)-like permease